MSDVVRSEYQITGSMRRICQTSNSIGIWGWPNAHQNLDSGSYNDDHFVTAIPWRAMQPGWEHWWIFLGSDSVTTDHVFPRRHSAIMLSEKMYFPNFLIRLAQADWTPWEPRTFVKKGLPENHCKKWLLNGEFLKEYRLRKWYGGDGSERKW